MKVSKLTRTIVNKAKVGVQGLTDGSYIMDESLPGFGLRVHKTRKTYIIRVRRRPIVLGPSYLLDLDEARGMAREKLRGYLLGAEELPVAGKTRTVASLAKQHLDIHSERASHENDKRNWGHILKAQVPSNPREEDSPLIAMGDIRLDGLREGHVWEMHHRVKNEPAKANAMVALLASAWNQTSSWGWTRRGTQNPADLGNNWRHETGHNDRELTDQEWIDIGKALDRAEQLDLWRPTMIVGIRAMMKTGCRPGEVVKWRVEDIDWKTGEVKQQTAKGDRKNKRVKGRRVFIPPRVLQQVRALDRTRSPEWVFGSAKKDNSPLYRTSFQEPWNRIKEMAGVTGDQAGLTIFRHSFSTRSAQVMPDTHRRDLLGHSTVKMSDWYRHTKSPEFQASIAAMEDHIDNLLKGRQTA